MVNKPLHENIWCNEEGLLGLMYYPVINPHTYLLGVNGVSTWLILKTWLVILKDEGATTNGYGYKAVW